MSDNKQYYYMKLKEDFFDSESMKILQGMKDGYIYSDILLKLYLQSLRQEGRLMYRDIIPYTPEMVATVTRHQVGTVEKAIEIFQRMGFIEILDNGAIYMMDIQNFIGQSSTEADRIRNYRKTINTEKSRISGNKDVTNVITDVITNDVQMYNKCTPENRDKSLENRDNNINNIARSSDKQTSEQEEDVEALILNDGTEWRPTKVLFAEYVRLYPSVDVKQQFNEMRSWCLSNPSKRKTKRGITRFINSWLAKEQDKGYRRPPAYGSYQQNPNTASPSPESGYSQDVLDRLTTETREDVLKRKGEW